MNTNRRDIIKETYEMPTVPAHIRTNVAENAREENKAQLYHLEVSEGLADCK